MLLPGCAILDTFFLVRIFSGEQSGYHMPKILKFDKIAFVTNIWDAKSYRVRLMTVLFKMNSLLS